MITDGMLIQLNNIVKKYAFKDWYNTNRKRINAKSYSLSAETNTAREMYNLALKGKEITLEEEIAVKEYVLKKIMLGDIDDILEATRIGVKYDPSAGYKM